MQLGARDVARILNVSEKSVYRWIRDGQLPAYKVNEQYRFNRAELLEWANAHKVNVSAGIFQEPDTSAEIMPSIADALEAGGIFYRLEASDAQSALRSVVGVMRLPADVDRDFLLQVLMARESMASTGVGEGIAIPHVRNPIVLNLHQPAICLCFLERAVDFGSLDGQPVHTLFTLLSPTVRAHLFVLSRLAFLLRDPAFKAVIGRQAVREEILAAAREAEQRIGPIHAAPQSGTP
jgi:PTS system nitrogen regulatory IIA component